MSVRLRAILPYRALGLCVIGFTVGFVLIRASLEAPSRPEVTLSEDAPYLTIQVSRNVGSVRIPWPFAAIEVDPIFIREHYGKGDPIALVTDAYGQIQLDLVELWLSGGHPYINPNVSRDGSQAPLHVRMKYRGHYVTAPFWFPDGFMENGARWAIQRLTPEAARLENEQKWTDALHVYRRIVNYDRGKASAWSSLARVAEKVERPIDAIIAYKELLVLDADYGPERMARQRRLKEKIVALVCRSKCDLPPMPDEVRFRLLARAQVSGHSKAAYRLAVEAQNAAPWSPEAYIEAGTIGYYAWLKEANSYDRMVNATSFDGWDLRRALQLSPESKSGERARVLLAEAERITARIRQVKDGAASLRQELEKLKGKTRGE